MSDNDDSLHLADAAAKGDRAAVDRLIERHLPGLRVFVRLKAGGDVMGHESVSDVVQSTCREVLENIERFRHPSEGAFRQWLFTTALRKISRKVEFWRAEKRDVHRVHSMDATSDAGSDAAFVHAFRGSMTPSRHAAAREEAARLEAAINALPEDQREIVTLAHVVGLSRAEIASQTGRSEGAVRVALHRALARLSAVLADDPT